ncbi:hypothetical protein GLAREA_12224 [Glarea lozoyensis ATCC 20868]|uniref:Uncharacterized protein n=1 Tax=Glarea lozoyensis (strain ATCC 20868 / MF5171) TaxID=1116229 RepID=S3D0T7_GLAL2|nr:uncharacterized protein GLAREA_12224 [Glarea lozoyensis ATCC 20868]EPE32142.1 hypothetical protein GLAREA_12224 [Glarea lozoyensis ATCC 20868]
MIRNDLEACFSGLSYSEIDQFPSVQHSRCLCLLFQQCWDSARVYSTNEIDRASLPPIDQDLISAWIKADLAQSEARFRASVAARNDALDASRVAEGLSTVAESERAFAVEMELGDYDMSTQKDMFDVASAMYTTGVEAWEFVVFKTWGCKEGERERWDIFWRRWKDVMDYRLRDMGAVGDLEEGIAGELVWWLVEDESMDGKPFQEVRDCFTELVKEAEEHIPLGLDLDLALFVDKESAETLLDCEEGSSALRSPDDDGVFVWGVDGNYDADDDRNGGDEYPGYFKISTTVLISGLWHTLNAQTPDELYPGDGQISKGI